LWTVTMTPTTKSRWIIQLEQALSAGIKPRR
jgi:hypothetical protein